MRKNKREILANALPNKRDTECSTKFAFNIDKTLVSFVLKKDRCVCLM